MSNLRDKRARHGIKDECMVVFDETHGFMFPVPKRVQTAPTEHGRRTGRRVRRKTTSRKGYTVCATYSLTKKGKLAILADQCSAAMRKAIESDFGDWVILVTGRGKVVNSTTHARVILPQQVVPLCGKLRQDFGEDEWCLYLEDMATGHAGDACHKTSDKGLKQVRKELFQENKIAREFLAANGGPEFSAPDQMFKVVKLMSQKPLEEVANLGDDLERRLRDEVAASHGGPYYTDVGNQKEPLCIMRVAHGLAHGPPCHR